MKTIKPIRTASGVAPIAVITKPWPCSSDCLYCPNDPRMPKSYLSDEPACQRAERNFFDPYLQVVSRLRALTHMGHATDKIELIVLGGTWCDYPPDYQIWFITELFRALNDGQYAERRAKRRRKEYKTATFTPESETGMDALLQEQVYNETAQHRVVGLTVETRPDLITVDKLIGFRRLGCTRVQIGVQSLDPEILRMNRRHTSPEQISDAFALLRLFGFKIHAHFMLNLYGSSLEQDREDYLRLVTDPAYLPDEIKLYPCSLVANTGLVEHHRDGSWQPYTEDQLIDLLATDTLNTPPFMRISRMIRDISAHDILAGSNRTNLRQMVEQRIEQSGRAADIQEIRYREINTADVDFKTLRLETVPYATTVSSEYFLQWVTPENRIAGFLRLSLPKEDAIAGLLVPRDPGSVLGMTGEGMLPINPGEAMIRELHVYGRAARISEAGEKVQHLGLGKQLIDAACAIARQQGYAKLNVISSVGTREYYRKRGFEDTELYQQLPLYWTHSSYSVSL